MVMNERYKKLDLCVKRTTKMEGGGEIKKKKKKKELKAFVSKQMGTAVCQTD